MIQILPMQSCHVADIARLETVCFSDPWSERSIASELTNPLSYWYVAMDGDHLCGYIGSQRVLDSADVMNVAVDPQYRRQGIGEMLVNKLVEELDRMDTHILLLEVRVSNDPAISLYEKLGFSVAGRRPNYYHNPKEDAWILRKEW